MLPRTNPDRPDVAPTEYRWRPVSGPEVLVHLYLVPGTGLCQVYRGDEYLGDVFRDGYAFYRWRRAGVDEMRGGQLRSYREACSALLWELRRAGRV